jgi:hypothetical protein
MSYEHRCAKVHAPQGVTQKLTVSEAPGFPLLIFSSLSITRQPNAGNRDHLRILFNDVIRGGTLSVAARRLKKA